MLLPFNFFHHFSFERFFVAFFVVHTHSGVYLGLAEGFSGLLAGTDEATDAGGVRLC